MRTYTFATRCTKEILRDPLNMVFGLGFPVVLLLLLTAIQANVPVDIFRIETLTPGITVFGLSFLSLFSATLIARDRESALLQRLYTTPLRPADYILGYLLPLLPMAVAQGGICYLVAIMLGLSPTIHILSAVFALIPMAILFISLGLLCGSVCNVKQVGGICGALLTNVSAWLSGIWFDLELVGEGFRRVANLLPFVHGVKLTQAALAGQYAQALPHLLPPLAYSAAILTAAIALFLRQMKRQ